MYDAIFPNLQNIPWGLIIAAFVGGFVVARKLPNFLPSLFAPSPDVAELVRKAVEEALAKK